MFLKFWPITIYIILFLAVAFVSVTTGSTKLEIIDLQYFAQNRTRDDDQSFDAATKNYDDHTAAAADDDYHRPRDSCKFADILLEKRQKHVRPFARRT